MDEIKFKVGEKWLARNGEVRVISEVDERLGEYPVFSHDEFGGDLESYTSAGKYYADGEESGKDLIRPVLQPNPASNADDFRDRLIMDLAPRAIHVMDGSGLMDFIDTIMARRAGKAEA